MATYEITHPNGGVYQVDAPDTMSQVDVMKQFQQSAASSNDMGHGAAAVQGFNAALPFGEKITAGLGAVGAKAYDSTIGDGDTTGQSIGDLYRQARDDQQATSNAHSGYYDAGMVAGAIPAMLMDGGALGAGADITGLSKLNATTTLAKTEGYGNLAARTAVGAAKGSAVGAAYGAGDAGNDQLGQGTVHGAEIGAMLGSAAPVLGAAGSYIMGAPTDKFLMDLTTPRAVGGVRKDIASNMSEEGWLNKATQNPDNYQQQVMNTVSNTGVTRGASNLANRETIQGALGDEADVLRQNIAGSKAIVNPQDIASRISTATQSALQDEPMLIGDGEKYLQMASDKMNALAKANPGTPEGLLDTRQQFDQWANSKSGFGDKDTAFRTAVSTVRGAVNKYIGDIVPTAQAQDSLTKQSHMYDAIDALNSKIPYDPQTRIGRAIASPAGKAIKYTGGAGVVYDAYHNIVKQLSSGGDDE